MLEITKERVDQGFVLSTLDFSALQTRLALIDMCINPEGLDPSLWDMYKPTSIMDDMHSKTGHSIFFDSVKRDIIEAELPSGKKVTFVPSEKVTVLRDGKETTVIGSEVRESDEWVGFPH